MKPEIEYLPDDSVDDAADLEIRGAGNILGPQQSGHINTVGYEMYCRLLADASTTPWRAVCLSCRSDERRGAGNGSETT